MEDTSWTFPTVDNPDAAIHPSLLRPHYHTKYYREDPTVRRDESLEGKPPERQLYRSSSEQRLRETTNHNHRVHRSTSSRLPPRVPAEPEQHRRSRSSADVRMTRSRSAANVSRTRSITSTRTDPEPWKRRRRSRRRRRGSRSRSHSKGRRKAKTKTKSLQSIILGDEQREGLDDTRSGSEFFDDWSPLSELPQLNCVAPKTTNPASARTAATSMEYVQPERTTEAPLCHGSAITKLTVELRNSILGCVENARGCGDDGQNDDHPGRRGRRKNKTLSSFVESMWQDSVDSVKDSFEASQEELSKSLYDKFESLEVYAGSERLHQSLDRYID